MKISYAREALKGVKKIRNKKLKDKVLAKIYEIKNASELNELKLLKKMSGHPTAYRIRIGDYRLGFYYENEIIFIARFLKRNDIYKVFPK